eukprot:Rmarinus@m.19500
MLLFLLLGFGGAAALAGPSSGVLLRDTNNLSFPKIHRHEGDAYVHLFEWTWTSVARECEEFLAPNQYTAVQISPPNEHRIITSPAYPWWQRYQPVSYVLGSRSGDREQFAQMVSRCKAVGVDIYADAVINHMAAGGSGLGSAGSYYNADRLDFPDYVAWDFHDCSGCDAWCGIGSYYDRWQVQHCRLEGLKDLDTGDRGYVVHRIAAYLNDLLSLGVAGFRIDAAKHMAASELEYLVSLLDNTSDGKRPVIMNEVIDLGYEPISKWEYVESGSVTEFVYGIQVSESVRGISGRSLKDLRYIGDGLLPSGLAFSFIDNHDNQRGHGAGGATLLTFREPREYTLANVFMLAWPYGFAQVMSSYYWEQDWQDGHDKNDWVGPPSDEHGNTKEADCNSHDWVCEHRWREIAAMVQFRKVCAGYGVSHWADNGNDVIGFSREDCGFMAMTTRSYFAATFPTGMAPGVYCNIIEGPDCSHTVTVNGDGTANVELGVGKGVPAVAIHQQARKS